MGADLHTPAADHLDRVEELGEHDTGRQPDQGIQCPLQRAVSFPECAPGLPSISPRLPHGSAETSSGGIALLETRRELHRDATVAETE